MAAHSVTVKPFDVPETVQLMLPSPPPGHVRGTQYVNPVVQLGTLEEETLDQMIREWSISVREVWSHQREQSRVG